MAITIYIYIYIYIYISRSVQWCHVCWPGQWLIWNMFFLSCPFITSPYDDPLSHHWSNAWAYFQHPQFTLFIWLSWKLHIHVIIKFVNTCMIFGVHTHTIYVKFIYILLFIFFLCGRPLKITLHISERGRTLYLASNGARMEESSVAATPAASSKNLYDYNMYHGHDTLTTCYRMHPCIKFDRHISQIHVFKVCTYVSCAEPPGRPTSWSVSCLLQWAWRRLDHIWWTGCGKPWCIYQTWHWTNPHASICCHVCHACLQCREPWYPSHTLYIYVYIYIYMYVYICKHVKVQHKFCPTTHTTSVWNFTCGVLKFAGIYMFDGHSHAP